MTETLRVYDGVVVSMQYTLHVDGKLVDASGEAEPLQFIQGMGHIIPGLEHELYDMQIGESKTVRFPRSTDTASSIPRLSWMSHARPSPPVSLSSPEPSCSCRIRPDIPFMPGSSRSQIRSSA
jgi:hypothetical protein